METYAEGLFTRARLMSYVIQTYTVWRRPSEEQSRRKPPRIPQPGGREGRG